MKKIEDLKNNVKPDPINNSERVQAFRNRGGQIRHFLPKENAEGSHGMTIAFIAKNGRVELSTSVQHRSDTFTKKIGTKLALDHFDAGKTVFFPVRRNRAAKEIIANFYWAI